MQHTLSQNRKIVQSSLASIPVSDERARNITTVWNLKSIRKVIIFPNTVVSYSAPSSTDQDFPRRRWKSTAQRTKDSQQVFAVQRKIHTAVQYRKCGYVRVQSRILDVVHLPGRFYLPCVYTLVRVLRALDFVFCFIIISDSSHSDGKSFYFLDDKKRGQEWDCKHYQEVGL